MRCAGSTSQQQIDLLLHDAVIPIGIADRDQSVSPEPDPKVGKRLAMRKQLAVESVVKVI